MRENGLLILRQLKVKNANAVAGLIWGFPAVSAFLGFDVYCSLTYAEIFDQLIRK